MAGRRTAGVDPLPSPMSGCYRASQIRRPRVARPRALLGRSVHYSCPGIRSARVTDRSSRNPETDEQILPDPAANRSCAERCYCAERMPHTSNGIAQHQLRLAGRIGAAARIHSSSVSGPAASDTTDAAIISRLLAGDLDYRWLICHLHSSPAPLMISPHPAAVRDICLMNPDTLIRPQPWLVLSDAVTRVPASARRE